MQTFIGFDEDALTYNRSYTIAAAMPGISSHTETYVSPIWATIEGNLLEELSGGAFDAAGRFIDAIAQPRSDGHNAFHLGQTATLPAQAGARIPKAVFGGIAFDHFGHFLLEATTRLWCLEQYKTLPWLFLTEGRTALKTYQNEFLKLLGLSAEQIIPIAEWHLIDELIIPEPSFVYHHHATHAYRDIFRQAKLPEQHRSGRKVFISRTNTNLALTVGERELESILAGNGWDIVCPETLPPAQQAALFRDDNILLGLQGSAMHLGLFAPDNRRVVHLCRGLGYRGYYLLDDLMGANATYLNAMRSHPLESKPIRGPFLLDLDKTIGFLRDQELINGTPVAGAAVPGDPIEQASRVALETEYAAWWHYTESQVRFHHRIAHDGSNVDQVSALESAMQAVALSPGNRMILCHAAALLMKFDGIEAAGQLIDHSGEVVHHAETPEDAELLYYISMLREAHSDYEGALSAASAAVARVPDNATYTNQLATVFFRLDRYEEAEALLRGIVDKGNAVSGNYFVLSLIARRIHDDATAIGWALEAVKADRNDEGTCRHLANLYNANDQPAEALATYQRFLERRPASLGVILDAADLALRIGDMAAAAAHCLEACRLDPDDLELARKCTGILSDAGQLPDLTRLGSPPVPAVQEQSVMIYRHSLALAEAGLIEQALPVAMIAAELFPDNETIMNNLLGLMVGAGRGMEARLLANRLIELGRASGALYYVLSLVEASLDKPERAMEAAARAVELDPANPEIGQHYRRFQELVSLAD